MSCGGSASEGGSDVPQQAGWSALGASSSSTSSDSRDSSASSDSGDGDAAGRRAAPALRGDARHKRDRGQSQMFGLCHITPFKWHALTRIIRPVLLSRSSAISGAATALRLLKAWAVLGPWAPCCKQGAAPARNSEASLAFLRRQNIG